MEAIKITPDVGLENLDRIIEDFKEFCDKKGDVSETDTRVKVIDAVLKQVCGWPERLISREDHVESGYTDYILSDRDKEIIVLEAKRQGISFECPESNQRKYVLSGSLLTNPNIKKAIDQVRTYCDDRAVRYAIATNGYIWIAFRAIRDDIPWRKGHATVFKSLEDIRNNFTDFWNLLSYICVSQGSLNKRFGSVELSERRLDKVLDCFRNPNRPLERNTLEPCLNPLIKYLFDDITNNTDILEKCYIFSRHFGIRATDINVVLSDTMPMQIKGIGGIQVTSTSDDAGDFGNQIANKIKDPSGEIYLLLGGIGAGKTTFIKRYQKTIGQKLLDEKTIWFHLDFLGTPLEVSEIELFVWHQVLEQLRSRYYTMRLENRQNLKGAFLDKIKVLRETELNDMSKKKQDYQNAVSVALQRWVEDPCSYVPRILKYANKSTGRKILLFIDNVDQHSAEYQAKIFLLAQKISRELEALAVVSLREESYFVPQVQRIFTAYTNRKYHISSPEFGALVNKRIDYVMQYILCQEDAKKLPSEIQELFEHKKDLIDFFNIVKDSIFSNNKKIVRFIDAVCFGNMRHALQMFSTFMCSGAIDVNKMLRIFRRDGFYYVAFHEWLKSIILQDRFYYKESQSHIMNVFSCGTEKNASHFSILRILELLKNARAKQTLIGDGYFEIARILTLFEDSFDNTENIVNSLNKLVRYQLVELDTKSMDSIESATHIRLNGAGWYYLIFLSKTFCYLDLMLQDTPINSSNILRNLVSSVQYVDNLYDLEAEKLKRTQARFSRVETFIQYLINEETEEFKKYNIGETYGLFNRKFSYRIQSFFKKEKEFITQKILNNLNKS